MDDPGYINSLKRALEGYRRGSITLGEAIDIIVISSDRFFSRHEHVHMAFPAIEPLPIPNMDPAKVGYPPTPVPLPDTDWEVELFRPPKTLAEVVDIRAAVHENHCSGHHWTEDDYGNERRIDCGCPCEDCRSY